MTLLPIQNALVQAFARKDTFGPADFAGIPIPKDLEPRREALIRSVLGDLAAAGMVRAIPAANDQPPDLWILTAPLGSSGQEIGISLSTAAEMADEINAYRDAMELQDEWPEADCLALNENSVLMLLAIISDLRTDDGGDDDGLHGGGQ